MVPPVCLNVLNQVFRAEPQERDKTTIECDGYTFKRCPNHKFRTLYLINARKTRTSCAWLTKKKNCPFPSFEINEIPQTFDGGINSLRIAKFRTADSRLELQEIKRLPIIEPPLNLLRLDVLQALSFENRTNTPGDLRVAWPQSAGLRSTILHKRFVESQQT